MYVHMGTHTIIVPIQGSCVSLALTPVGPLLGLFLNWLTVYCDQIDVKKGMSLLLKKSGSSLVYKLETLNHK